VLLGRFERCAEHLHHLTAHQERQADAEVFAQLRRQGQEPSQGSIAGSAVAGVEDLADDVEGRREIGSAHAEEKSHCFADLGVQRVQFRNRSH